LLLLGVMLWQVLSADNPRMRQVTMEELEVAEAANLKFIEELEAGSEMDYMNALTNLMATYNQSPLLTAVIEALMQGNEEEPELARETVGLELLREDSFGLPGPVAPGSFQRKGYEWLEAEWHPDPCSPGRNRLR
jgi:hypothetical protein